MKNKGLIITGIVIGFLILMVTFKWVSVNNSEIEMRGNVEAQQEVCKANFDKMFKVTVQIAGVAEQNMKRSKEAFKEIYPQLMEGRYSNDRGGALMSWIQESNPTFDLSTTSKLYANLQVAIESNREAYFLEQKKLESFYKEHSVYIKKFPNNIFVGGRGTVKITIITSDVTEAVYNKGVENNINLFEN